MAKRYIDTNFYKSPFVRGLQGSFKSLYSFIICECSNAGVWIKDFEVATLYTGFKINEKEFNEVFIKSNKLINLGNGKYFLPDFVEFQYPNGLSNSNPAHKNIISELLKFNLLDKNLKVQVSPLSVPNNGTKEKVMDKDKEEEEEKEEEESGLKIEKSELEKFIKDLDWLNLVTEWLDYKKDRKETYKSLRSTEAMYKKLLNMSENNIETAKKIIENAIALNYSGFFAIDNNKPNQPQKSQQQQFFKKDEVQQVPSHLKKVFNFENNDNG